MVLSDANNTDESSFERWYPIAAGAISFVVYWVFISSTPPPKTFASVLGSVVSVAGIAVGFFAAAQSIFISIDNSLIIKRLKELGRYKVVIRHLHAAMTYSFLLALMSGVGLLKDFETSHWPPFIVSLWIGAMVTATLSCLRIILLYKKILDHVTD